MTSLSIYEFYLINSLYDQKYNKKLLSLLGFNSNLSENDNLKEAIRKCEELGKNGWAICPYWKVDLEKGETIIGTWYDKIVNNPAEDIAIIFQKNNYELLNSVIGYSTFQLPSHMYLWMNEARILFFEQKYLSCAMVLTAIIEGSIRNCPIEVWRQRTTIYFESVKENIKNEYLEADLLEKLYDYFYILSSLNKFISCFFDGNKPFDKKEEPSYLERNWLMHGMTKRTVSEIDCIKLFNVISSLQFLLDKYNSKNR
ncbi:hypothetical protein ABE073_00520 [Lederbergia citrisecunda]|uniref:hypothetical protein n=1 Tax=Lederbergia citrisecunda TaxID=2833583 RepID=UPI003D28A677